MSWFPSDDETMPPRRPYYPETSGLCNCDNCTSDPTQEEAP